MKKGSIRLSFLLVLMLGLWQAHGQSTIDITFPNNTTTNPVSICQCDTLGTSLDLVSGVPKSQPLKYFIGGNALPGGTDFYYEMFYNYGGTPSSPDDSLFLFRLTPPAPNESNPIDTFATGNKWAHLVIPCDAPVGLAALRIRHSSTPTISDTVYFNINQMPNKPVIDSIKGGFPSIYPPAGDNWAFCEGDSVMLYAGSQPGNPNITWLMNGSPFLDENGFPYTDDSLVVKAPGVYALRLDFGFCERDSKDTTIVISRPQTDITFSPTSPGFQIDNPNSLFLNPIDSIQFCENQTAVLVGPEPDPLLGLTYTYEWLTDSIDSFGDTIFYTARGKSDSIFFNPDTTARFYVVTNDGFCTDTSAPYYAFEDSIPENLINHQFASNGVWGTQMQSVEICMRDSILLSSDIPLIMNSVTTDTLLEFQWQRRNLSSNTWADLPNAVNPGLDGKDWTLQVDTSLKPIAPLSFYRLRVWTQTPFSKSRVCAFTTDSIVVRWKPEEFITFRQATGVVSVDRNSRIDSVNLCARDSVQLLAPVTPGQMVTFGYNYTYQWVRDSLDTALNRFVKVPVSNGTGQSIYVKESGRYYVYTDDGICADTLGSFRVFVDSIPATTLVNVPSNADRLLCLDESVTISATDTVFGANRWNYGWFMDDGTGGGFVPLPTDTLPWITIDTSYLPGGGDTLRFVLGTIYTNQFGLTICPDTSEIVEVVFFRPPNINFFPGDSIGVCPGDSVLVVAQGNSFTYVWSDGAVTADNWLSGAGTYTVTGTGANGCTNSRNVTVYDLQTTANAGADVTILSGETATLSATGGTRYQWGADKPIAWGDILSQSTTVSYTLPEGVKSDTIKVYVTVFNTDGCQASDTLLLIVNVDESPGTALIDQAWNVFTPDGNGKSDVWDITGITNQYGGCQIDILNRWGSTIYTNESFNGIWDGNNNGGNPVPDGTYYYILSCDGEILLKNAVTIIRNQ